MNLFGIFLLVLSSLGSSMVYAEKGGISSGIRINSVGLHPEYSKKATIVGSKQKRFQLVQIGNDAEVVFEGTLGSPMLQDDSSETVRVADFSEFKKTGAYRMTVSDLGSSAAFSIGPKAYEESLLLHMLGFYGQRCGMAVRLENNGNLFSHFACHTYDGHTDYIGAKGKMDGTGGWHDAGDYNKYSLNAAATLGMMLSAWERYEPVLEDLNPAVSRAQENLPYYLDEVKWELDWLLKMQLKDGRVSHKLSALRFNRFEMPDEEKEPRYFSDWGSPATGAFAGAMAMAYRVFKEKDAAFASLCLDAARRAWQALKEHPQQHDPDQIRFKTGGYTSGDLDDRIWAAGELFRSTGEAQYETDFKDLVSRVRSKVSSDWDWSDLKNLGMWAYLAVDSSKTDPDLRSEIEHSSLEAADHLVKQGLQHGYGRDLQRYYWGSNGSLARSAMLLDVAYSLTGQSKYLDTMQDQASYLYGRNPYGRSQVTGEGYLPPLNPHHRPSGGDKIEDPWPGLLVGGGWPDGKSWEDAQSNHQVNETAINWSGAMVYMLASLSSPHAKPNRVIQRQAGLKTDDKLVQLPKFCGQTAVLAFNAGGEKLIDSQGMEWFADQPWTRGNWGYLGGVPAEFTPPVSGAIDGQTPLYQSERFGKNLAYRFSLPAGWYKLEMKMAENYFDKAGVRVFDVYAGFEKILSGVDIYKNAGKNAAWNSEVIVHVAAGDLSLYLEAQADHAKLSAMKISQMELCPK